MRILSIDGGGIRGIIPGQVLVALEAEITKLSNGKFTRIADVFDLIAGTSTGGILTCLYLSPDKNNPPRPRYSALEAVDLYIQNGDDIFDRSIFKTIGSFGGLSDEKYSADTLEEALKEYFGDIKLSELLKPCLITAYDIYERQAKFFNQSDVAEDGLGREFYVRDIARATSAAPTYFEPANIRAFDKKVYPLVDGGVFANNPAMCACVEAFSSDSKLGVRDLKILSLGTGMAETPYHYSEAKGWGKLQWVIPVLDIIQSGVAETVDYQLASLFRAVKCPTQYLRVQADLKKYDVDPALDNASKDNMAALKEIGTDLAKQKSTELTAFIKSILTP